MAMPFPVFHAPHFFGPSVAILDNFLIPRAIVLANFCLRSAVLYSGFFLLLFQFANFLSVINYFLLGFFSSPALYGHFTSSPRVLPSRTYTYIVCCVAGDGDTMCFSFFILGRVSLLLWTIYRFLER